MVAHGPSQVRLAQDVVFVENVTGMEPGEGLWETASALPQSYVIHVPDPVSQQVARLITTRSIPNPSATCTARRCR
jgi:hypothetical protein